MPADLAHRLQRSGINVTADHIYTSALATADHRWLSAVWRRKFAFLTTLWK
jgi:hypothetical protein